MKLHNSKSVLALLLCLQPFLSSATIPNYSGDKGSAFSLAALATGITGAVSSLGWAGCSAIKGAYHRYQSKRLSGNLDTLRGDFQQKLNTHCVLYPCWDPTISQKHSDIICRGHSEEDATEANTTFRKQKQEPHMLKEAEIENKIWAHEKAIASSDKSRSKAFRMFRFSTLLSMVGLASFASTKSASPVTK